MSVNLHLATRSTTRFRGHADLFCVQSVPCQFQRMMYHENAYVTYAPWKYTMKMHPQRMHPVFLWPSKGTISVTTAQDGGQELHNTTVGAALIAWSHSRFSLCYARQTWTWGSDYLKPLANPCWGGSSNSSVLKVLTSLGSHSRRQLIFSSSSHLMTHI